MRSIEIRTNICNLTRCRASQFFTKNANKAVTLLLNIIIFFILDNNLQSVDMTDKIPVVKLGQKMELGPGIARILGPLVLGRSSSLK